MGFVLGCEGLCEGLKPALVMGSVGCEGLNACIDKNNQQQKVNQLAEVSPHQNIEETPCNPTQPMQGFGFNPTPTTNGVELNPTHELPSLPGAKAEEWQAVEVEIMGVWHGGYQRSTSGRWLAPTGTTPLVAPKVWRIARPLSPGVRVKVGNHFGTLATPTPNGKWLIDWDNLSASQRKQYGSPPASWCASLRANPINLGGDMTQPRIDAIAQRLCFLVGVNGSNAEPIRVADWVKIVLTYLQYQGYVFS